MSLKQWQDNGWLRPHKTSTKEITDLFEIANRDLSDAQKDISEDWKFGIAYNAALKLCTILLYAEGYRPEKNLAHYRTLQALPIILGGHRKSDAEYLDSCRSKRNEVEYEHVGGVSYSDVEDLIEFVTILRDDVLKWLQTNHSALVGGTSQKTIFKSIFTKRDGSQRVVQVEAKSLEEAITKLIDLKNIDENMDTPVKA